ncbi:uncharacterized protein AMSG_09624 [Thecamonas trahens ATCC 50062]|uniref:DOMON domain-containing protein n=1 Tax=Thecamonas trahens ATCC 50062 TaxID=461836 RepID=A0A0L0DPM6_THETB|nr:hypothetical protein AMSG_09624 [Thecamonas trahens ATCC 50062]KNC53976.1 hypothetical protein AMSG_09624 [Thecamonas trahens ATCC 50062]|eukprot:XP_013754178.1 hypothetical protein AMSG_09624 [Thecamonas trahens ATCC 50062]
MIVTRRVVGIACLAVLVAVLAAGPAHGALSDGMECQRVNELLDIKVYWNKTSATTVDLAISAPIDAGWLGLARFSGGTMSGGDFAFAFLDGTTPKVLDGFRSAAGNEVISIDSTNSLTNRAVERVGGVLTARWTKALDAPADSEDLTWAGTGSNAMAFAMSTSNPSDPPVSSDFHSGAYNKFSIDFTTTAVCTPPPPPAAPPPPSSAAVDLTDAFTYADGDFVMKFKVDTVRNVISMSLSKSGTAGWVAVCFTTRPGLMGPGDVLMAYASTAASGGYIVSDRQNPSGRAAPAADAQQDAQAVAGAEVGGRMTVEFVRALNTNEAGDAVITNSDINIVWAIGSATPGGGAGTALSLPSKHASTSTSEIKINFFTGKVTEDNLRERIIKAHAWLMILAWIFMIPGGILTARYLKDALGVWWFRVHRVTQWLAVLMTFAAFGMAIWFTQEDFKGENKAHKIIGLLIVIVTFFEPILGELANLMWSPDRKGTPIFPDILHWWFGRFLSLFAMINVYLGMKAKEWGAAPYVIVSLAIAGYFIAFIVLQFFVGAVHHNASDDDDDGTEMK